MLLVKKEKLRKVVPVAVKYTFSGRNILVARRIEAGRPLHGTPIFIIGLVTADRIHQAALVKTEMMKTCQVKNKKSGEKYSGHPYAGQPSGIPKDLLLRWLFLVQIRLDLAFEVFGKLCLSRRPK